MKLEYEINWRSNIGMRLEGHICDEGGCWGNCGRSVEGIGETPVLGLGVRFGVGLGGGFDVTTIGSCQVTDSFSGP